MPICSTPLSRTFILSMTVLAAIASLSSPLRAQSLTSDPATVATKPGSNSTSSIPVAATATVATQNVSQAPPAWHEAAVPSDKAISAQIRGGVFTVDGLVAKVQLDYTIHDAGYFYFYVPGLGTAIVSQFEMRNSIKVVDGIKGDTLAFDVGGHSFELSCEGAILTLPKGKADVYVRLDTQTNSLDHYPMVGYGNTTQAPYDWPLSAPRAKSATAHLVHSVPKSMLPRVQSDSTGLTLIKAEDTAKPPVSTANDR